MIKRQNKVSKNALYKGVLKLLSKLQQKEKIIRDKGCQALLDIVDSQIILYEIENLNTPTSIQDLIAGGYLKKGQDRCPTGEAIEIVDGQATAQ